MTKLLDEEIEDDEQFWNQDALKEVLRFILDDLAAPVRGILDLPGDPRASRAPFKLSDKLLGLERFWLMGIRRLNSY